MFYQLLSHNFAIDTSECFARPGRIKPVAACELNSGMFNLNFSLVVSLYPFSIATEMFWLDVKCLQLEFGIVKWVVGQESAIAVSFVFVRTK